MTNWRRRTSHLRHRHFGYRLEQFGFLLLLCALAATWKTSWGPLVALPGQMLVVFSNAMQVRHRLGPPCTECVKEMPLNPEETAQGHRSSRTALRAAHSLLVITGVGLLSVGLQAVSLWLQLEVLGTGRTSWTAYIFLSLGIGLTLATNWMTYTHNRLMPWCPYCRDDDDDDDEESPTPSPADGRDHPVPA
ncbi:hypothetical protein [Streptomyces sp. NBC_00091]|uniref:hypothetical protein n=1 Tax=Streptomyces sp. NBC_00091 TaxID=2975648 RepID=UPI00224DED59|nr:hypothetical protein [Streptomyces sp. NBC_00091]MCX5377302.1 hypothetical protein [Streptomyces sp. NBC_00091]